jgi:hypothetical protein
MYYLQLRGVTLCGMWHTFWLPLVCENTYRRYGLATGNGFSLRVHRAGNLASEIHVEPDLRQVFSDFACPSISDTTLSSSVTRFDGLAFLSAIIGSNVGKEFRRAYDLSSRQFSRTTRIEDGVA